MTFCFFLQLLPEVFSTYHIRTLFAIEITRRMLRIRHTRRVIEKVIAFIDWPHLHHTID